MTSLIYFRLTVHHHLSASSVIPGGCLRYLWPFGLICSKDTESFVHFSFVWFFSPFFGHCLLYTCTVYLFIHSFIHPSIHITHPSINPCIHPSMSFDASEANSATASTIPLGHVSYLRPFCHNALSSCSLMNAYKPWEKKSQAYSIVQGLMFMTTEHDRISRYWLLTCATQRAMSCTS